MFTSREALGLRGMGEHSSWLRTIAHIKKNQSAYHETDLFGIITISEETYQYTIYHEFSSTKRTSHPITAFLGSIHISINRLNVAVQRRNRHRGRRP